MEFGIDEANRLVITNGHKSIIQPRILDFNDFPTTLTSLTAGTFNYKNWIVTCSGTQYWQVQNQNNGRLFAKTYTMSSKSSTTMFVMTNRNIKGSLLTFGTSYELDANAQYVYGNIIAELVKPDGTSLVTLYTKTTQQTWGWLSFNIWWNENTCYINRLGCMLESYESDTSRDSSSEWETYWNNGSDNYYNSYSLVDTDIRLRFCFNTSTGDTSNDSYAEGYISNVLIG